MDGIFINLNILTLICVMLGGTTLGLYFAALNKFKKAENIASGMVTFVVMGWSFYIPFMFATMVSQPAGDPLRFVGSMFLWVIFMGATTGAYYVASLVVQKSRED